MAKSAKDSMAKLREDRKAQGLKNYNLWLQPELVDAVTKPGETIAETIGRALQALAKEQAQEESEAAPEESEINEIRQQLAALSARVEGIETVITVKTVSTVTPQPSAEILAAWQAIKAPEDVAQALQNFPPPDVKALCRSLGVPFHYADAKGKIFQKLSKHLKESDSQAAS